MLATPAMCHACSRVQLDALPQAGSVSAQLAICPEYQPCTMAKGKVCLMQRIFGMTCKQLEGCMANGGRAAIFYGQSYENSCQVPGGLELNGAQCGAKAWVPTIGISRAQAEALISHHSSGKLTEVGGLLVHLFCLCFLSSASARMPCRAPAADPGDRPWAQRSAAGSTRCC
jgi:hypothetical protein